MFLKCSVPPAILLSAALACACGGHDTPTAPSLSPQPVVTAPQPPPQHSSVVTWDVTATLSSARGAECSKEAVESLMKTSGFSLSLVQNGDTHSVSIKSRPEGFTCTIPVRVDGTDFTSVGVHAYYTCDPFTLIAGYRCSTGRVVSLITFGQDITGKTSGDDISGTWSAFWLSPSDDDLDLEATAQFSGKRQ